MDAANAMPLSPGMGGPMSPLQQMDHGAYDNNMADTMRGFPGDPSLQVGGAGIRPTQPQGAHDYEVAHMGDEINPPPVSFHQAPGFRNGPGAQNIMAL